MQHCLEAEKYQNMLMSTLHLTRVIKSCKISNASLPDLPFDFKLVRCLTYPAVENEAQKQIIKVRMHLQQRSISLTQDTKPEAHADL